MTVKMAALEEEIAEPLHALQALQSWPLNFQLPAEELLSYIQNNIEICRQIWPTYQDRHRQEITIHGNDSTFTFTLGPITTVASFLQARQSLFGTGSPNLPFQKWNPPFTRSLDEGGRLPHPDRSSQEAPRSSSGHDRHQVDGARQFKRRCPIGPKSLNPSVTSMFMASAL